MTKVGRKIIHGILLPRGAFLRRGVFYALFPDKPFHAEVSQ
jgi:hypothetical protein